MDGQELSKKARKELKRQEKLAKAGKERTQRKTKKLLYWFVAALVVAGAGWFGLQAITPEPLEQDYSQAMPHEGANHVSEGSRVIYRSNPPTSGSHWPTPLRDGVYETEKPDEAIVHSLEHGRVWVSYRPEIGEAAVAQLKEAVRGEPAVILSPRAANETDVALAAWTRLDAFNLEDEETPDGKRIKDFIRRYRNKGPEYVPQNTGKTYE